MDSYQFTIVIFSLAVIFSFLSVCISIWIFSNKLEKSNENDRVSEEILRDVNKKMNDIYKNTSEIKEQCKKSDTVQASVPDTVTAKINAMDGRIDTLDSKISTLDKNIYMMNNTVSRLVTEVEGMRSEKSTEMIANFLRLQGENKKSIEEKK